MVEKIRVVREGDGFEIIANREGLVGLAIVCLQLAMLPEDNKQAKKMGNHYHYEPFMNNAEEGSLEMTILYKPDL
jgi:hypothetical protein